MNSIATYFGHPVTIVRRGRKHTRIRFTSGRVKLVPTEKIRHPAREIDLV